ncbi:hypothetical protein COEREDRAFT_8778 [Coemansia reversa NRRL 1564]|uniref:Uncharacterized protein n=1 Tax=Coemansia reversa (strain ATCC 12441 / NRRL 1564) TaxID=763665 RepID=A0A2G5BAS6_COERN|nr:hypothetical protein COEREDRAFT_8778 [Coemansia reversa NRRL 1564]|eukprot:PIA16118.1 hypothetical protein COEREDRAFT_8778 [Coemansia reversa NRRL 1564]
MRVFVPTLATITETVCVAKSNTDSWAEAQRGPLVLFENEMPPEGPEFADITLEYIQECRGHLEKAAETVCVAKPNTDSWAEAQRGPLVLFENEMPPEGPEFADITMQYIQECRNYCCNSTPLVSLSLSAASYPGESRSSSRLGRKSDTSLRRPSKRVVTGKVVSTQKPSSRTLPPSAMVTKEMVEPIKAPSLKQGQQEKLSL